MNRRQFLLVTAALASAPAFIRRAFADQSIGVPEGRGLAGALERAKKLDRPLVMLVIPAGDQAKYERGAAFGELFNHGTDAQLAPLSHVDVICAGMEEARRIDGDLPSGEPLMVLFRPHASGKLALALDAELPKYDPAWERNADWKTQQAKEDRRANQRITILSSLVARLGPITDAAAQADEVRARLVKRRIPGSHWANASGCGTEVEGDQDSEGMHVACGMGHVPSKSSRFLYLYAKTPGQMMREERARRELK